MRPEALESAHRKARRLTTAKKTTPPPAAISNETPTPTTPPEVLACERSDEAGQDYRVDPELHREDDPHYILGR